MDRLLICAQIALGAGSKEFKIMIGTGPKALGPNYGRYGFGGVRNYDRRELKKETSYARITIGTGSKELGITRLEEVKYNESRGVSTAAPGDPLFGP